MSHIPIKYSTFFKASFFALGYGILFFLLQFFFATTGVFQNHLNTDIIKLWDVSFYESIRSKGYNLTTDNTGFFPLFPYIWKITHLGIWGIIGFNVLLFALGFGILMKEVDTKDRQFWILCLTIPSVYFAFIPYTEALFFFLGAVLLNAVGKQKLWLIWITLILTSLVRATAFFLLPAFFVAELFSAPIKNIGKSILSFFTKYAIPILIGLGIFIVWQFIETGIWFAYFKKQSDVWGHVFSWPKFPFTNIENADWRFHWLSALALFINLIAVVYLIFQLIQWMKNKHVADIKLLISLGYLSMVLISILFMNPKYGAHLTNVMGANRYTLIAPFFFYALHYFYKRIYSLKEILFILIGLLLFTSLFQSLKSVNHFIITGLFPCLLVTSFMVSRNKENQWLLIAIIAFNFFMQLNLFQQFIGNLYMD